MSENDKKVQLDLTLFEDNLMMDMTLGEVENLYDNIHKCCDVCGGNLAKPMTAKESGNVDCHRCPVGIVLDATREYME